MTGTSQFTQLREKSITLSDSPYTVTSAYNSINVTTTGGNVRVNLPDMDYPIKVNKVTDDSYLVTLFVTGTQIGEIAGYQSSVTIESGQITKDEPWYPYEIIMGHAGVSGDGGETLLKNKYGKRLSSSWVCESGIDDTLVAQAGITASVGGVFFALPGTYLINPVRDSSPNYHGLNVPSNTGIVLSPLAVLQSIPVANDAYSLVMFQYASHSYIEGGIVKGERASHLSEPVYADGHGHGISILASSDIQVRNTHVQDCWGDGLYLGSVVRDAALTGNIDIRVQYSTFYNNRRNNVSLVNGKVVKFAGCNFNYANGTLPEEGLDIEPNTYNVGGVDYMDTVYDVSIHACHAELNKYAGMRICGANGYAHNISFYGNTFYSNSMHGNGVEADIELYQSSHATLIGNVHRRSGARAIRAYSFTDAVIGDNVISFPNREGVSVMYGHDIKIHDNRVYGAGQLSNATYDAYSVEQNASDIYLVGNSSVLPSVGNLTRYGCSVTSNGAGIRLENNDFAGSTGVLYFTNITIECNGNVGYIAPGEIRTLSGSISTLTENAFNSLDNPFGQAVRLLSLDIYVSAGATATSPNIDCGIGSSATTDYTTLFDDLPGETIGFYRSTIATPGTQTVPQLWESGSGNRYLNMSIKDAAATGMVATYVATVMGL